MDEKKEKVSALRKGPRHRTLTLDPDSIRKVQKYPNPNSRRGRGKEGFGTNKKRNEMKRKPNPNPRSRFDSIRMNSPVRKTERRRETGVGIRTPNPNPIPHISSDKRRTTKSKRTRGRRKGREKKPTRTGFSPAREKKCRAGQLLAGLGQGGAAARPLDGGVLTRRGARAPARGPATAPWLAAPPSRSRRLALGHSLGSRVAALR